MKFILKNPVVLILLCLMTGMFVTVSFLETPLKFQVPGITLPIALGLGKLMFGISTNIQAAFLVFIMVFMIISRKNYTKTDFILFSILTCILILEKFWMLPVMDIRADALSAGKALPATPLHDYFIYAEVIKIILLIAAILSQFKKKQIQS
ncbi:hypothetical protein [Chryseobacterium sp.]|uniref:hypothetical protein n=1 Tax=Chryseobacterium sp. TaxID=1871047 RepID=UPI00289E83DE|nr:hypothetical protein [Chryseobacterium sp.]